jgi:hypothetical protein
VSAGHVVSAAIAGALTVAALRSGVGEQLIVFALAKAPALAEQIPPESMKFLVAEANVAIVATGVVSVIVKLLVASLVSRRRRRTFCVLVAAGECIEFPYGTVLAVYTLWVLTRKTVRELFDVAPGAQRQSRGQT